MAEEPQQLSSSGEAGEVGAGDNSHPHDVGDDDRGQSKSSRAAVAPGAAVTVVM